MLPRVSTRWLSASRFLSRTIFVTSQIDTTAVRLVYTKRELLFLECLCSSSHPTLRHARMLGIDRPTIVPASVLTTQCPDLLDVTVVPRTH